MASKTSIKLLFDTLEKKTTSTIPEQLLTKCADEYDELTKKIPKEKRPREDLIRLILTVKQGKYHRTKTANLLSKAKEDHRSLLTQLDIIRQSAQEHSNAKHQTSDGKIQTLDPSTIADLTNPQDNNSSNKHQPGKPKQNEPALQKQVGAEGENDISTCQQSDSVTPENRKGDVINEQIITSQTQLSRDASNQLKQNNPNIADLSDTNRPTKLAERFSELYDNEWTNAYEALHNDLRLHEKTTTELLIAVVKGAYKFCTENAERQMYDLQMCCKTIVTFGSEKDKTDVIPNDQTGDKSSLLLYRKSIAGLGIKRLQKTFCDDPSNLNDLCSNAGISKSPSPTGPIVLFANKCVELCWWMCVQDPPIFLDAATYPKFNSTIYRAYTKSGTSVDFYVWPALMLYKGGPVLMKGVAQCC